MGTHLNRREVVMPSNYILCDIIRGFLVNWFQQRQIFVLNSRFQTLSVGDLALQGGR